MLEGDDAFAGVTHIILDEVHEVRYILAVSRMPRSATVERGCGDICANKLTSHQRQLDGDFLLLALRDILAKRSDLRVILMSATVDADRFSEYLGRCQVLTVPGRTFPVQTLWLEDAIELTGYRVAGDSPYARHEPLVRPRTDQVPEVDLDDSDDEERGLANALNISYGTRMTLDTMNQSVVNLDLIVALLEHICFRNEAMIPFSTAILVFMPSFVAPDSIALIRTDSRRSAAASTCSRRIPHSALSTSASSASTRACPAMASSVSSSVHRPACARSSSPPVRSHNLVAHADGSQTSPKRA